MKIITNKQGSYGKTTSFPLTKAAKPTVKSLSHPLLEEYQKHLLSRYLAEATVASLCSHASIFLSYLKTNALDVATITRQNLADYWAKSGKTHQHSSMHTFRHGLSSFLKWLNDIGVISDDFALALPSVTGRVSRIKSLYSQEEIRAVLSACDRSCDIGKRDYAMLLIGASFALRAKDVIDLKIDDIKLSNSAISIITSKTKRLHTMDMSDTVACAIADYLLNARPKCEDEHLFVTSSPPYHKFSSSSVCASILKKYITLAGIDPKGRSTGFHVFRVFAASSLLGADTSLFVISEFLGHANPNSVMSYISTDEKHMRSCCLSLADLITY